jgi:hypothetical protein
VTPDLAPTRPMTPVEGFEGDYRDLAPTLPVTPNGELADAPTLPVTPNGELDDASALPVTQVHGGLEEEMPGSGASPPESPPARFAWSRFARDLFTRVCAKLQV